MKIDTLVRSRGFWTCQMMVLFALLLVGISSCQPNPSGSSDADGVLRIDLESHIGRSDTLKASDYFATVEYIPLETDSLYFVGNNPLVRLYRDTLIVSFGQSGGKCFAFTLRGSFLHAIGRYGKGESEYRQAGSYRLNEYSGELYFQGWASGSYVKYDLQGNYRGSVTLMESGLRLGMIASTAGPMTFVTQQDVALYHPAMPMGKQLSSQLLSFCRENDTTLQGAFRNPRITALIPFEKITNFSMMGGEAERTWGILGRDGGISLKTGDDKEYYGFYGTSYFWKYNDFTYFKECFNDTAYRISPQQMEPRLIFNLGSYHWPYDKMFMYSTYAASSAYVTWVTETPELVLFQYFHNREVYNGVYRKSDRTVVSSPLLQGIQDDINGFLSHRIMTITPEGDLVSLVQPLAIRAWFEENPDKAAKLPEQLKQLRKISEEANPVVVVMRQKR